MFCLLENNYLIDGPFAWNQRRFQTILQDDHDLEFALPYHNDSKIVINENLQLLPVSQTIYPDYNPKIQQLVGPTVTVNTDDVVLTYTAIDKPLESVKAELKAIIAANRYQEEIAGTSLTVNGATITVPTDRDSRNMFAQALSLGAFDKNWKFGETWVVLNQADLTTVVGAILAHVQAAFDWEKTVIDQLDAAADLAALDLVAVVKA